MRSDTMKKGPERAPHRGLMRATGLKKEDFDKPFIGVCNSYTNIVPGHCHLKKVGEIICDAIREGHVRLVVYAAGAAENSTKRVTDKAKSYHTAALAIDTTPEALGRAVGKSGAVAAVGVTDAGFAGALTKILQS